MHESNFAFLAQNRGAVRISSQIYERRGALIMIHFRTLNNQISTWERLVLDTCSPLPLFDPYRALANATYCIRLQHRRRRYDRLV
jgi:hypothetical protein